MNINFANGVKSLNKIFNKNSFASTPVFKGYLPNDSFERQAKNEQIMPFQDFIMKYNYPEGEAIRAIQGGGIKISGLNSEQAQRRTSFLRSEVDLSDPATIKELEKHLKLRPVQSEKIYNAIPVYYPPVSIQYLSKLGYGDLVQLATMLKRGYLSGVIRKSSTPKDDKTVYLVDISSKTNKAKLQNLRDKNESTVESTALAKRLKMTLKELEKRTLDGEVDIIPRFIYPEDYKKVFYNLRNPKNKEFMDKRLFELELIQQNKMSRSDSSLKMKLIWYFAPNTRAVAHKLAMGNGLAKLAIAKSKKGIELTEEENEKLSAYYNSMWRKAGTAEFQKAREWGTMVYEDYKRKGIEAVDDPELREFILNIVNSQQ